MNFIERIIKNQNGNSLFTESIGNPRNPAIILIMGAMNQGIFWYNSFCEYLSTNNFFVIRFDHRDTGMSYVVDYKIDPYNLDDMTSDVVDIIETYNIKKANIIGLSMGGYLCQLLGVNYSDKIISLSLISTTADHRPYMESTTGKISNKFDLPYPRKKYLDFIRKSKENPPITDNDFFNNQKEGWKVTFDEISRNDFSKIIKLIELSNHRAYNKYSTFNHAFAVMNSEDRLNIIKNIKLPTFIYHGDKDPCFPIEHGYKLNELISGSIIEIIKDMGHMFSVTESKLLQKLIIDNLKKYN
ncbi:MAG TPA: alpha/beta hydrolase [Spirochaetia bacterium]|nr:alpha/beta hydrolase [Spirochaetia bacterium]